MSDVLPGESIRFEHTPGTEAPADLLLKGFFLGIERVPCVVIGETAHRFRVRLLKACRLPSNRTGSAGDVVLVPKHAVAPREGSDEA